MKAQFYSALSQLFSRMAISVVILLIIGLVLPGMASADVTSQEEQVVSVSPDLSEIDRSATGTNSNLSTVSTNNDVNAEAIDPQVSNFWINDNRITDGEDVTVYVSGQAETGIYYDHTLEIIDETGLSDEVIAEESISLSESSFTADITVENLEQPGVGYGDERELSVRLTQESTTCIYDCGVSDRSETQEYTIYDADSVDPDPSVEGVSDTFSSGINHESGFYTFENGEPIETPTVTTGDEVTVQLYVRNEGGNAGDFSSIQMQFPDFNEEADGEFITHTYGTGEGSIYDVVEIEPGDTVYNADDTASTASSWGVEWTDARYGWLSDEVKLLEVTFEPQDTGTFSVYYRATLTDDVEQDGEHNKFTTPSWAVQDDPDQDGYDMYSFEIDVEPENEPPTADAGGPYSVLADSSIDLDASDSYDPDGGSVDVDWSLIDGPGSINGDTYSAPTSVSGDTSVTVEVEVTDDHGATDTDTATITVNERAAPNADAGGSYSVSEGESINLDASDSFAPNSEIVDTDWSLNHGPGSLSGDTYTAPSPISSDESVTVEVEVTDNYGKSDTDTATISIASDAAPTADAGGPYDTDSGGSVSLDASGSTAPSSEIVDIDWTLDDGPGLLSGNTYTAPSDVSDDVTATVSATVTDSNGATDTDSATITIEAPDPPEADAGGPYSVEEGDSVTLDSSGSVAPGGTIVDTEWTVIAGPGSINSGTYHAPTSISSDTSATIELKVTDSNGATATDTTTISIGAPNPAVFGVSITDTNSPVEEGEDLEVTAEIENEGDVSDTQTVDLDVSGLGTDSESVQLDGSSDTTETFEVSTGSNDVGDYTAEVESEGDSTTAPVTVQADEDDPFFAVEITGTNSPVEEGEDLEVTAEIENQGDISDTQTVDFTVEEGFDTLGSDSSSISLDGGDSQTETFSVSTTAGDAGDYTAEVASADDPDTTDIEIDEADTSEGAVDSVLHPSTIGQDETFSIDITTDASAATVVDFELDGFAVDLTSDDAVQITDARVEFVDPTVGPSTYTIDVDVSESAPGDTGTISVWVNSDAEASADDSTVSTFKIDDGHASGVSQTVWNTVTDQNHPTDELTLQDLIDSIQAYQDSGALAGAEVSLQDLIDLIQWYQANGADTASATSILTEGGTNAEVSAENQTTSPDDGAITNLDHPESVPDDGQFDVTVETANSAGTVVEFDTDDTTIDVSSEDAVQIVENRVEFLDTSAGDSAYTITVDVSDTDTDGEIDIAAWVNAELREDADDEATGTVAIDVATDPGFITGDVIDTDGNTLSGVEIEFTNTETDETRTTTSGDTGAYVVELQPGPYEIRVDESGFEEFLGPPLLVESGQTQNVDILLEPTETVSYQSGDITSVVTDANDDPVDARIFVNELVDDDANVAITFEPDDVQELESFTATVTDGDDVVETVDLTADEMRNFAFQGFDSQLELAEGEDEFELLTDRFVDQPTLSPVPAVDEDPGVSLALTGVSQTGEIGQSVLTPVEIDRTSTASIVIPRDGPDPVPFEVEVLLEEFSIEAGDTLTVETVVSNPEEGALDAQSIEFGLETPDTTYTRTRTVSLASGESTTEVVSFSTDVEDAGAAEVYAVSETDTDTESGTITEPDDSDSPGSFDISSVETNTPAAPGDTLVIQTDIQNTGDLSDTKRVEAIIPNLGRTSKLVSLVGGDSTAVELSIPTDAGDNGKYGLVVETPDDVEEVPITIESDTSPVAEYTNDQGIVESDGLQRAFSDWQAGLIEGDLLQEVFTAWQSGEPVE